jgi:hypothetical protein
MVSDKQAAKTAVTDERVRGKRERRAEEQQRRMAVALQREQRRRRAMWGGGILAAALAVAALVFFVTRPQVVAQGRQVPTEGQQHVQPGTPITYRSRPPASGPHFGTGTSGYGVFERDVEPGFWVHTLEHGGIVVLYRPDLCGPECLNQLRQVYESAPLSQRFNRVKMAVIPYAEMESAIAAVAWGRVDELDQVDSDRILAFYRAYLDRGPELAL